MNPHKIIELFPFALLTHLGNDSRMAYAVLFTSHIVSRKDRKRFH